MDDEIENAMDNTIKDTQIKDNTIKDNASEMNDAASGRVEKKRDCNRRSAFKNRGRILVGGCRGGRIMRGGHNVRIFNLKGRVHLLWRGNNDSNFRGMIGDFREHFRCRGGRGELVGHGPFWRGSSWGGRFSGQSSRIGGWEDRVGGQVNHGGGSQEGDWLCPNNECRKLNIFWRKVCWKCKVDKPESGNDNGCQEEDWVCLDNDCRNRNSSWRKQCWRCSKDKNEDGCREGDWICPDFECGKSNIFWRNQCWRCKLDKPEEENDNEIEEPKYNNVSELQEHCQLAQTTNLEDSETEAPKNNHVGELQEQCQLAQAAKPEESMTLKECFDESMETNFMLACKIIDEI